MKTLVIGADTDVEINGVRVGMCEGVDFDSVTERIEQFGIDIQHPQELKAGRVFARMRVSLLRNTGDGGAQGAGIVAQAADTSGERYATVLFRDRRSDQPIFATEFSEVESESWRFDPKGIGRGNVSLKVIAWTNEAST